MNYIIFDLEWNYAAGEADVVTTPYPLTNEIIEIGAVMLDDQFQPVDQFKALIRPKFYPRLHNHITALTGIHDRDLAASGLPFPEAYEAFLQWCGETYTFMTWSASDLPVLIDNMLMYGMDISRFPPFCDLQRIFSREIMRSSTRYSLDTALSIMKEKGETAHDALHDARNTAKLCAHLDLEKYLHEYTGRVFGEAPIQTEHDRRSALLEDPALREFPCPCCGQKVSCEPWIPYSFGSCISYGVCPEEDEFFIDLTIRRGKAPLSVKRLIYELSDDLWDVYMDQKEPLGV